MRKVAFEIKIFINKPQFNNNGHPSCEGSKSIFSIKSSW